MNITPLNDGAGTEALKAANAQREVRQTPRVEPKKPIPSTEEWHGYVPVPPADRRHVGNRRRGDRRRNDSREAPLLDTRDHHERRTNLRRASDRLAAAAALAVANDETPAPSRGVDLFA